MLLECPDCRTSFRVPEGALGVDGRRVRCSKCSFEWFAEPRDLKPSEADSAVEETTEEEVDATEEEDTEEASAEEQDSEEEDDGAFASLMEETDEETDLEEDADTEENLLPARKATSMVILWFVLLLLTSITALIVFRHAILEYVPALQPLYDSIGFANTEGLALSDLSMTKTTSQTKAGTVSTSYTIYGKIINVSEESRALPDVRIRMMDKENNELFGQQFAAGMAAAPTKEGESPKTSLAPKETFPFTLSGLKSSLYAQRMHHFTIDVGSSSELMFRD